jgi:hypothetical protein
MTSPTSNLTKALSENATLLSNIFNPPPPPSPTATQPPPAQQAWSTVVSRGNRNQQKPRPTQQEDMSSAPRKVYWKSTISKTITKLAPYPNVCRMDFGGWAGRHLPDHNIVLGALRKQLNNFATITTFTALPQQRSFTIEFKTQDDMARNINKMIRIHNAYIGEEVTVRMIHLHRTTSTWKIEGVQSNVTAQQVMAAFTTKECQPQRCAKNCYPGFPGISNGRVFVTCAHDTNYRPPTQIKLEVIPGHHEYFEVLPAGFMSPADLERAKNTGVAEEQQKQAEEQQKQAEEQQKQAEQQQKQTDAQAKPNTSSSPADTAAADKSPETSPAPETPPEIKNPVVAGRLIIDEGSPSRPNDEPGRESNVPGITESASTPAKPKGGKVDQRPHTVDPNQTKQPLSPIQPTHLKLMDSSPEDGELSESHDNDTPTTPPGTNPEANDTVEEAITPVSTRGGSKSAVEGVLFMGVNWGK